jgi:hypothetical protein
LLDPALRDVNDGAAPTSVYAADEHPVFVAGLAGANRVSVLVAQSAPSIKVNVTVFKDAASRGHSAWAQWSALPKGLIGVMWHLGIRLETYKSQDRVAMDAPRRQSVKL